MPGTKEERAFLIRDGSKVIQRAVLSSPKLTGGEVENFAALKNVNLDVLRPISMNLKFMKNCSVLRNLVNNPRLPIDAGLPLLNRLIVNDLRTLSINKNIPRNGPQNGRKDAQRPEELAYNSALSDRAPVLEH